MGGSDVQHLIPTVASSSLLVCCKYAHERTLNNYSGKKLDSRFNEPGHSRICNSMWTLFEEWWSLFSYEGLFCIFLFWSERSRSMKWMVKITWWIGFRPSWWWLMRIIFLLNILWEIFEGCNWFNFTESVKW